MIWRFESGELRFVSELAGYTNHRIGERDIAGGIRSCNGRPEMIVSWQRRLVKIHPDLPLPLL